MVSKDIYNLILEVHGFLKYVSSIFIKVFGVTVKVAKNLINEFPEFIHIFLSAVIKFVFIWYGYILVVTCSASLARYDTATCHSSFTRYPVLAWMMSKIDIDFRATK